jgi:hypothetical protein
MWFSLLAQESPSVAGPVITASASLVGVIVGGLLTGLLQDIRERRRETRLARIGARVMAADLAGAAAALAAIRDTGSLAPEQIPDPPASWDTYRAALAGWLDRDGWTRVSAAVTVIGTLSRELPMLVPGGMLARPSDATLTRISAAVTVIGEAVKKLVPAS